MTIRFDLQNPFLEPVLNQILLQTGFWVKNLFFSIYAIKSKIFETGVCSKLIPVYRAESGYWNPFRLFFKAIFGFRKQRFLKSTSVSLQTRLDSFPDFVARQFKVASSFFFQTSYDSISVQKYKCQHRNSFLELLLISISVIKIDFLRFL